MITNAPEIVHIPLKYQQFKSSLDLPHAAAAIIRHSSSTTRTLGMSYTNCYIQITITMSSSLSSTTTTEQHEQQIATTPTNESSISSQQLIGNLVLSSPTVPILHDQIRTQRDHEDNLVDDINEIIYNFLSRFSGQQPYHAMFRWTLNDVPIVKFSVVLSIDRSDDL